MINTIEKKRKQQKAEDFIGWKSPDGRLEVIGIAGKQGTNTTFKVTCTECSKDKELFPDGYFISTKGDLIKSKKPCRCSKFNWEYWQFLVLAKRSAGSRFIVHGFSEEFHGQKTKLNLECLKDGHKWTARSNDIINGGTGVLSVLVFTDQQNKKRYKNVLISAKKWVTMLLVLLMDIKEYIRHVSSIFA